MTAPYWGTNVSKSKGARCGLHAERSRASNLSSQRVSLVKTPIQSQALLSKIRKPTDNLPYCFVLIAGLIHLLSEHLALANILENHTLFLFVIMFRCGWASQAFWISSFVLPLLNMSPHPYTPYCGNALSQN
jgi:hypothetical protein